jgi:hypothetical protein
MAKPVLTLPWSSTLEQNSLYSSEPALLLRPGTLKVPRLLLRKLRRFVNTEREIDEIL